MSVRTMNPAPASTMSGIAQVNLLPPEVRAKRGLARTKRWLAAVIALALLVAAGTVALATMTQRAADEELRLAEEHTQALLAEQAQYGEVPTVLSELEAIKASRTLAMSTEVLWPQYLSAIAATAPEGVSIDTIAVAGATPMLLPATPVDPLQKPSVSTVTFGASALAVPDTAAWLEGLETVPGFADAWFTAATVTEREGQTTYTVTATVQIDERAYAERFVVEEES